MCIRDRREAARLDSFIQALSRTSGNQVEMAEGGAAGIADRARNERLTRVVENERLTRMRGLLHEHGIELSRRQIAMDQNGDLNLNLTPQTAAAMWKAGLINESQLGAVANGGHARFSFAHNDLLVSSSTGFSRSARNDTSTRFEAGKQAGPDTIEHFLGGGAEGHAAMANWLRGGFEMDRKGNWRLKPQVADTIQRDVSAVMAQTGWQRSLSRSAEHSASIATSISGNISGSASRGGGPSGAEFLTAPVVTVGRTSGSIGIESVDRGATAETGSSSLDIVNYNVRDVIALAERAAARSTNPATVFTGYLAEKVLGNDGLRNHYLEQADAARGVLDPSAPLTSMEQSSIARTGRMSLDPAGGPTDGDPSFKSRRDQ